MPDRRAQRAAARGRRGRRKIESGDHGDRYVASRDFLSQLQPAHVPRSREWHAIGEALQARTHLRGRTARTWILVSDDDSLDRILDEAESRGAEILWRNHYWAEFNGFNGAFVDPWGNTFVLWVKGGDDPQVPEGWTRE